MSFRESDAELAHSCEWCGDSPRNLYAVASNLIERWRVARQTNGGKMTAELADHLGRLERCLAHVVKGIDAHFDAIHPEMAEQRALVRKGREAVIEAEVKKALASVSEKDAQELFQQLTNGAAAIAKRPPLHIAGQLVRFVDAQGVLRIGTICQPGAQGGPNPLKGYTYRVLVAQPRPDGTPDVHHVDESLTGTSRIVGLAYEPKAVDE